MKRFLIYTLSILFFIIYHSTFASIHAKEGDVVIFNYPQTHYFLQIQLFVCQHQMISCQSNQLIPITKQSPSLGPEQYFTFDLSRIGSTLVGKTIYAQITKNKKSSSMIILIDPYNNQESPFYQYICWYPLNSEALCSTGHDNKIFGY